MSAVPSKMKAFAQTVYGSPAKFAKFIEVPVPAVQPKDILVKIHAVATNPVDTLAATAFFSQPDGTDVGKTMIVGWDAAGVVVQLGTEASKFKVGDEVFFSGVLTRDGCFAEYTAVDERIVALKPKKLSFVEAAAQPLAAITAFESLVEVARVNADGGGAGKSCLIINGAGGVGSVASQIAKKVLKFDVVVSTASRPETQEFCKAHGADFTINHRNDMKAELASVAGLSNGADVILNLADVNKNFGQLVDLCAPLAQIVLVTRTLQPVDIGPFMEKRITIGYELMFSRPIFDHFPEKQGELLANVASWLDDGTLKPRVLPENIFKIQDIAKAFASQDSGTTMGKIAIDCSDFPALS